MEYKEWNETIEFSNETASTSKIYRESISRISMDRSVRRIHTHALIVAATLKLTFNLA
jgi:hypothetical protein